MPGRTAHILEQKWRSDDIKIGEDADFSSLLLPKELLRGLTGAGYKYPSPIQLRAIPTAKIGKDLIVQAKSGTGKTLVFTVTALNMLLKGATHPQVLIMAPTREIAFQICQVIKCVGVPYKGLKCEYFIGGRKLEEDVPRIQGCHIIVGTPGRIKQLINYKLLKTSGIRLFVLDEADQLLKESSFTTDIDDIFRALPRDKQMIATSATYPDKLKKLTNKYFREPLLICLNKNDIGLLGMVHYYRIIPVSKLPVVAYKEKLKFMENVLLSVKFAQCLVFCNMVSRVENLCVEIKNWGFATSYISSAREQQDRLKAIELLKRFKCKVLVSSDVSARGIDAENVDLVINFDLPSQLDTYFHRVGRAGRYGSKCASVTFITSDEIEAYERMQTDGKFTSFLLPDVVPEDLVSLLPKVKPIVKYEALLDVKSDDSSDESDSGSDKDKLIEQDLASLQPKVKTSVKNEALLVVKSDDSSDESGSGSDKDKLIEQDLASLQPKVKTSVKNEALLDVKSDDSSDESGGGSDKDKLIEQDLASLQPKVKPSVKNEELTSNDNKFSPESLKHYGSSFHQFHYDERKDLIVNISEDLVHEIAQASGNEEIVNQVSEIEEQTWLKQNESENKIQNSSQDSQLMLLSTPKAEELLGVKSSDSSGESSSGSDKDKLIEHNLVSLQSKVKPSVKNEELPLNDNKFSPETLKQYRSSLHQFHYDVRKDFIVNISEDLVHEIAQGCGNEKIVNQVSEIEEQTCLKHNESENNIQNPSVDSQLMLLNTLKAEALLGVKSSDSSSESSSGSNNDKFIEHFNLWLAGILKIKPSAKNKFKYSETESDIDQYSKESPSLQQGRHTLDKTNFGYRTKTVNKPVGNKMSSNNSETSSSETEMESHCLEETISSLEVSNQRKRKGNEKIVKQVSEIEEQTCLKQNESENKIQNSSLDSQLMLFSTPKAEALVGVKSGDSSGESSSGSDKDKLIEHFNLWLASIPKIKPSDENKVKYSETESGVDQYSKESPSGLQHKSDDSSGESSSGSDEDKLSEHFNLWPASTHKIKPSAQNKIKYSDSETESDVNQYSKESPSGLQHGRRTLNKTNFGCIKKTVNRHVGNKISYNSETSSSETEMESHYPEETIPSLKVSDQRKRNGYIKNQTLPKTEPSQFYYARNETSNPYFNPASERPILCPPHPNYQMQPSYFASNPYYPPYSQQFQSNGNGQFLGTQCSHQIQPTYVPNPLSQPYPIECPLKESCQIRKMQPKSKCVRGRHTAGCSTGNSHLQRNSNPSKNPKYLQSSHQMQLSQYAYNQCFVASQHPCHPPNETCQSKSCTAWYDIFYKQWQFINQC